MVTLNGLICVIKYGFLENYWIISEYNNVVLLSFTWMISLIMNLINMIYYYMIEERTLLLYP